MNYLAVVKQIADWCCTLTATAAMSSSTAAAAAASQVPKSRGPVINGGKPTANGGKTQTSKHLPAEADESHHHHSKQVGDHYGSGSESSSSSSSGYSSSSSSGSEHKRGRHRRAKADIQAPPAAQKAASASRNKPVGDHLRREREMGKALGLSTKEEKLTEKCVQFDFAFTVEDLKAGNKASVGVAQVKELFQQVKLVGDSEVEYVGDPTRAVLRCVLVKSKNSDAPMPLTYSINHLLNKNLAAIVAKRGKTHHYAASGLAALDEVRANTFVEYRDKKAPVLYEDSSHVDQQLLQKYGTVTEQDLRRGIVVVKPANHQSNTPEDQKHWSCNVTIKGENRNEVVAHLLWKNQKKLDKWGVDYACLRNEAKQTKDSITLPYLFVEHLVEEVAKKGGISRVRHYQINLMDTQVMLGKPHGGRAGDFSGFQEYLNANFNGALLGVMRSQVYHVSIVLKFIYAMPDVGRSTSGGQ